MRYRAGGRLVERVGVARGGCVGEPADQQAGRLQAGEDLVGPRVVGQVGSGGGAHDLLGGQAQEQVPLAGLEGREHLGRHPVGDRGRAGRRSGARRRPGRVRSRSRAR